MVFTDDVLLWKLADDDDPFLVFVKCDAYGMRCSSSCGAVAYRRIFTEIYGENFQVPAVTCK
jgi:hypothetical protein